MDAQDAAHTFVDLFPDVYRRFHRRVHHTEYQLTSESLAVVQHLADAGPLTVTEASRHLGRSQAATSEILSRLVDRGLLARMPDERDRRRILVWLTPLGHETLQESRSVLAFHLVHRAMNQLPARQRNALIQGMQELLLKDAELEKDQP